MAIQYTTIPIQPTFSSVTMGVKKKASQSTRLLSETKTMADLDSHISKRTNSMMKKMSVYVGTRRTDAFEYKKVTSKAHVYDVIFR